MQSHTGLDDALDELAGAHEGLDMIRAGLRLLADDNTLTADTTQTVVAILAGSPGTDVLTAVALLVRKLGSPSNPAVAALPPARREMAQRMAEMTVDYLTEDRLHQPAAEVSAAIYGI
jgi:predicted PP-loop superfamily ATPase